MTLGVVAYIHEASFIVEAGGESCRVHAKARGSGAFSKDLAGLVFKMNRKEFRPQDNKRKSRNSFSWKNKQLVVGERS